MLALPTCGEEQESLHVQLRVIGTIETTWMKWHLKLLHRLADRLARLPGIASPWLANDSFDGLRLQKAVEVNPGTS